METENHNSDLNSKKDLQKHGKSLDLSSIDPEILDTFLKVRSLRQAMNNRLLGNSWVAAEPGIQLGL